MLNSKPDSKLNILLRKIRKRSELTNILISGSSWSLITSVLGVGLFFGAHILIARLAGPKSYGDYFYVLTIINLMALFCKLGLDTATLRFVPIYRIKSEWGLLRGYFRRVTQVSFFVSMFCAGATAIVIFFMWNRLEVELAKSFMVACLVLPSTVIIHILAARLQALKCIFLSKAPSELIRPIFLILLTFLSFYAFSLTPRASTIMGVEFISIVIALFGSIYFLRKSIPSPVFEVQPKYETKKWLKTAMPLSLMSSFHLILKQSDVIMVGIFLGTTQAGIYGVASRVAMLLGFGLNAVNSIAAPMISEFYSQSKMKELQRMVSLSNCGVLVFSILVGVLLITLGKFALGLFGSTFVGGYVALVVLLIGQLINALAGPTGYLMTMTGYQKQAAQIVFVSVVLTFH